MSSLFSQFYTYQRNYLYQTIYSHHCTYKNILILGIFQIFNLLMLIVFDWLALNRIRCKWVYVKIQSIEVWHQNMTKKVTFLNLENKLFSIWSSNNVSWPLYKSIFKSCIIIVLNQYLHKSNYIPNYNYVSKYNLYVCKVVVVRFKLLSSAKRNLAKWNSAR